MILKKNIVSSASFTCGFLKMSVFPGDFEGAKSIKITKIILSLGQGIINVVISCHYRLFVLKKFADFRYRFPEHAHLHLDLFYQVVMLHKSKERFAVTNAGATA